MNKSFLNEFSNLKLKAFLIVEYFLYFFSRFLYRNNKEIDEDSLEKFVKGYVVIKNNKSKYEERIQNDSLIVDKQFTENDKFIVDEQKTLDKIIWLTKKKMNSFKGKEYIKTYYKSKEIRGYYQSLKDYKIYQNNIITPSIDILYSNNILVSDPLELNTPVNEFFLYTSDNIFFLKKDINGISKEDIIKKDFFSSLYIWKDKKVKLIKGNNKEEKNYFIFSTNNVIYLYTCNIINLYNFK